MKKLLYILIVLLTFNPFVVLANTTTPTTSSTTTKTQNSKTYISTEDLEQYKEKLQNDDGTVQLETSTIFLYKTNEDKEIILLLAEKNQFSDDIYNSLVAVVEVMFDKEISDYVKDNYKSVKNSHSFKGFNIEVMPPLHLWEDTLIEQFGGKHIRVTVNRKDALNALKDVEVVEKDFKSLIESILTDQTKLTTETFLGFPIIEVLIFLFIVCLIIYLLICIFLTNFHKEMCGQRSIMAFIPVLNFYILGKLTVNKIFGFIFLFIFILNGKINLTLNGNETTYVILPDNIRKYIYIGYALIVLILLIYGTFKYDRVKSEAGGITLNKLKTKKIKKNIITEQNNGIETPTNAPINQVMETIPATLPVDNSANNIQPALLNNQVSPQVNQDINNNQNQQY